MLTVALGVVVGSTVLGGAGANTRAHSQSCLSVVAKVHSRDGYACGPWTIPPTPPPAPTTTTTTVPATTTTSTSTAPASFLPPGSWHLILDSEFTGTSLPAPWSTGWGGTEITAPVNSEELECYDPANVSVGNGALVLSLTAQTETCGGQTRPYASGIVTTNGSFSFTYGYVEARVWLDGTQAILNWPAVWATGQSWPTDGELDVLEGLGGDACWHFHDLSGGPGGCAAGNYTGWHTFGADWEPGVVTFYYDGMDVGSIASGITAFPMFLVLNLASDKLYGGPIWAPSSMRVQYVRVYQH
jgi:hypothetical protein